MKLETGQTLIEKADNGCVVTFAEDGVEGVIQHKNVYEFDEDNKEKIVDMFYSILEQSCQIYNGKHNETNIRITLVKEKHDKTN